MNLPLDRREFVASAGLSVLGALAVPNLLRAESPDRRVKIAQIGTAHTHAPGKFETLQKLGQTPLLECVGVWEPDPEARRAAEAQKEFEGAHWLTEDELFSRKDLDGVLVETELPDLLKMGRRALEAGWPIHMDKPPGANLEEFIALQDLAARKSLVFQIGYMYRYHPAVLHCFDVLRKGTLGRIFQVDADLGKFMTPSRLPWLGEHYGGSMMVLGSHYLDLAIAILGKPDRVTAFRRRTFPEKNQLYDNETAILQYPRALATVRSMLTQVAGEERRTLSVFGDQGSFEIMPIEPAKARLALRRPAAGMKAGYHDIKLPELSGRYDGILTDFAGMIQGRPTQLPQYTPAHDRIVQTTLLEISRS